MSNELLFRQHNSLLIIDHQTYWHTFAANALQSAGYQVHTLQSYEDVSSKLDGQTFDLVILGCASVDVPERFLIAHLLARYLHLIVFANTLTAAMIRTLFLQGIDNAVEKTHDSTHLLYYVDQAIERIASREKHHFSEKRRV